MYEKCVFKVAEYSPDVRIFEALSTANMRELDRLMQVIEEWVYNPKSDKRLELTIVSAGVRKQLDRRIKDQYNASGMFFHYSRASTSCRCEKTKRFKQQNYLRGFAKKEEAATDMVASLGFFDQE